MRVNGCLPQGRQRVPLLSLALFPCRASLLIVRSGGLLLRLVRFKTRTESQQEVIKWFYRNVKPTSPNDSPSLLESFKQLCSCFFFPDYMLTFVLRWRGNADDNACAQEDKVNLAGAFCDC